MVKPIDWAIEEMERKRRVPIPLGVTNFQNRDRLDSLLDKKNIEGITVFFDNPKNFDFSSLGFLSSELTKKRNIGSGDSSFIGKLAIEIKKCKKYDSPLSNSVGCFLQIEETFAETPLDKLPKKIRIALLFWSYLTVIESAVSDISELFYRVALNKDDKKYINLYEDLLKRGEHPLFGQLKKTALRWQLIKPQDVTFLNTNNLRNYISHANLYYDSVRDKVLLPNREELSFENFLSEYVRVYDFFKELIFKLNDENNDIEVTIDKLRKNLAREYRKLARSGATKKIWKFNIKMPWEKKKS